MMNEINSAAMEIADEEMDNVAGGFDYALADAVHKMVLLKEDRLYKFTDSNGNVHTGSKAEMRHLRANEHRMARGDAKRAVVAEILDHDENAEWYGKLARKHARASHHAITKVG